MDNIPLIVFPYLCLFLLASTLLFVLSTLKDLETSPIQLVSLIELHRTKNNFFASACEHVFSFASR